MNPEDYAAYLAWREERLLEPNTSIETYLREQAAYAALEEKENQ